MGLDDHNTLYHAPIRYRAVRLVRIKSRMVIVGRQCWVKRAELDHLPGYDGISVIRIYVALFAMAESLFTPDRQGLPQ